jgi:hypothetical protein
VRAPGGLAGPRHRGRHAGRGMSQSDTSIP